MRKAPELRIKWSKRENDFVVDYDSKANGSWFIHRIVGRRKVVGPPSTPDKARIELYGVDWNPNVRVFDVDFVEEMRQRGYDPTTLRVSLRRKA